MRSINMRLSKVMAALVQEEAREQGVSVAQFCREAIITRTTISAARRGEAWADADAWDEMSKIADEAIERVRQLVERADDPRDPRATE